MIPAHHAHEAQQRKEAAEVSQSHRPSTPPEPVQSDGEGRAADGIEGPIPAEMLPRRVVERKRGLGYDVTLECGHTLWLVHDPGTFSFCDTCINEFVKRLKANARAQESVEGA